MATPVDCLIGNRIRTCVRSTEDCHNFQCRSSRQLGIVALSPFVSPPYASSCRLVKTIWFRSSSRAQSTVTSHPAQGTRGREFDHRTRLDSQCCVVFKYRCLANKMQIATHMCPTTASEFPSDSNTICVFILTKIVSAVDRRKFGIPTD